MAKEKMYLYGKNSVLERLRVNPGSIKKAFLQRNFKNTELIEALEKKRISLEYVGENELKRIKKADRLQGIVAEVDDFAYADFEELLHKEGEKLSFIFLDNINDPHNLGSIIRIAACFGRFGVVIPEHRSCSVTDAVMHVASGGENFTPVSIVTNASSALIKAKEAGYWIVGAVVEGGEDINKSDFPFPVCLVLGSEGKGIRHGVDKNLDFRVSVPMHGASLSFNVAMACAIFCHEIARRRPKNKAA